MNALIYGISGQDGAYLAELLLSKGYTVWGASRDAHAGKRENLRALGIDDKIHYLSTALTDFRSVLASIDTAQPDEIYNLSGQTSVSLSFEEPFETMCSISLGTLNLLECLRYTHSQARLYHAGSSECFGDTGGLPATETTPFHPRSPYGVAKAAAHWQVTNYRESYNLFACTGILFNHESPLRPPRFVTRKVIAAVAAMARGEDVKLRLGNTAIVRDWGWAPEYVHAMWLMLQQPEPKDYVIATGQSYSLNTFVETALRSIGKTMEQHVETDNAMLRPSETMRAYADPSKAAHELGWTARSTMHDVVRLMLQAEQAAHQAKAE